VRGAIPAEIVFESETALGFKDIHPQAPVHVLLVPKAHVARLVDLGSSDDGFPAEIHRAARVLAAKFNLMESGFRLVVNNGPDAGQAVEHLHYHFLGGRRMGWPPG
jgi:histidine triad (HIT) family protein